MEEQKSPLGKWGVAILLFGYTINVVAVAMWIMAAVIADSIADLGIVVLGMGIGASGTMAMILSGVIISVYSHAIASGKQDEASNSSDRGT